MSGYDPTVVNTLQSGFTYGFKIDFQGKCHNSISNNLLSAFNNPTVVDLKLSKELEAGRIAGPFDTQLFDNIRVSPLGVIPKKTPGEFRMIHNLSFPRGKSINDFIPDEFSSVKYATVDDAIRIIKQFGVGCAMAKTDVRNAFRITPIHPSDFPLLGFQWRGKWYYDHCLPMGCSSSCQIFETFSTALEWVARTKLGITNIIHILDDFLIINRTIDQCATSLNTFLRFCDYVGVPIAPEKTEGPVHVLTFAGIELDCPTLEARLPKEKVIKCVDLLQHFLTRKKVRLKELQSLIGFLNFACSVIVPGRVFLRRLINLTIGIKHLAHQIRLSNEVKQDLRMWKTFCSGFNCRSFFLEDAWASSEHLNFYTDAAKSLGFGIVFGASWTYGEWPENWKVKDISFLEFFPILLALNLWCDRLKNKRVMFISDNDSVVHVINKQTAKDKHLLVLLRQLVLICLNNNILFRARHIKGCKNVFADSLSRLHVDKFKKLAKGWDMDCLRTRVPNHLQPENWELCLPS